MPHPGILRCRETDLIDSPDDFPRQAGLDRMTQNILAPRPAVDAGPMPVFRVEAGRTRVEFVCSACAVTTTTDHALPICLPPAAEWAAAARASLPGADAIITSLVAELAASSASQPGTGCGAPGAQGCEPALDDPGVAPSDTSAECTSGCISPAVLRGESLRQLKSGMTAWRSGTGSHYAGRM